MAHIYRVIAIAVFTIFFTVSSQAAVWAGRDSYGSVLWTDETIGISCKPYYNSDWGAPTLQSGTAGAVGAVYTCGPPFNVTVGITNCIAPAVAAPNTGVCTGAPPPTPPCLPPNTLNASGVCVPPPSVCQWASGQTMVAFGTFYIERGKALCNMGCLFTLNGDAGHSSDSKRESATAPWFDMRTSGDFTGTGAECGSTPTGASTGGSTPPATPPTTPPVVAPPPDKCDPGKVPGEVNGVTICVPPGETNSKNTSNTDTTDPAGSTTHKTVTNETNCNATTCTTQTTTTTTTSNSAGVAGPPVVTNNFNAVGRGEYCKTNTKEVACGGAGSATGTNSGAGGSGGGSGGSGSGGTGTGTGTGSTPGTFGGACGAEPACTGDAVQCAQAVYVFKTSCALAKPTTSTELTTYAAAAADSAGDRTDGLAANKSVAISSSSFDATELLGGAQGMQDVNVSIMGHALTMPFSSVNPYLQYLGMLLQACTFLLCIRIISRG